jgi:hypothetical protein
VRLLCAENLDRLAQKAAQEIGFTPVEGGQNIRTKLFFCIIAMMLKSYKM